MEKKLIFFLTILLASCSSENGNSVVGDQLTVFYENEEEQNIAEKIAIFWKENNLITGQKQDLKITSEEESYVLKIIASSPQKNSSIPYEELKLLLQLESDLNKKIADYPIEIVICNNQFEPIYNVD